MSKYRGPRIRMIRRLGDLPALTQKTTGRTSRPGQHGARRRKPTQFAYRLVEKQKQNHFSNPLTQISLGRLQWRA